VVVPRGGEAPFDAGDQFSSQVLLPDDLTNRQRQLLPGDAPVDVLVRLGDRRGDLGKSGVLILGQAGVQPHDEVGLQRDDHLVVELAAQHLRHVGIARVLLRPSVRITIERNC
jgi:hypothetical protein